MKTTKKARAALVAALRSGNYAQTTGKLHRRENGRDTFCCLGVACQVAIKDGIPLSVDERGEVVEYDDERHLLPANVRDWLGFTDSHGGYLGGSLVQLNDAGATFEEVAAVIESEPANLCIT